MASGTWSWTKRKSGNFEESSRDSLGILENNKEEDMSWVDKKSDVEYINTPDDSDDFDFVMAYDDDPAESDERLLPENSAKSAISWKF